jgi:protein-disulfide isomerase
MSLQRKPDTDDWKRGGPDAPVKLVEYGDFQCPFCGAAYPELKKLEAELGDELQFIFRHFPLTRVHLYAQLAAEAAEAAGSQGRFWEMHDALYENQDDLEPGAVLAYAAGLDLDVRRFASELEDHRHLPKIRRDFMDGVRSGVNGTPTFFINGALYRGPSTADALHAAIDGREGEAYEPMTDLSY